MGGGTFFDMKDAVTKLKPNCLELLEERARQVAREDQAPQEGASKPQRQAQRGFRRQKRRIRGKSSDPPDPDSGEQAGQDHDQV